MPVFQSIGRGLAAAGRGIQGAFADPGKSRALLGFARAFTTSGYPTPASTLVDVATQQNEQRIFTGALGEMAEADKRRAEGRPGVQLSTRFTDLLSPEQRVATRGIFTQEKLAPLQEAKELAGIEESETRAIQNKAVARNLNSIAIERDALLEVETKIKEATATQLNQMNKKYGMDMNELQARIDRIKAMTPAEIELTKAQTAQAYSNAYRMAQDVGGMDFKERSLQITRVQDQLYQGGVWAAKAMGVEGLVETDPSTGQISFKFKNPQDGKRFEEYVNNVMEAYRKSGYNPDVLLNTQFAEVFINKKVPKVDVPGYPSVFTPPSFEGPQPATTKQPDVKDYTNKSYFQE